MKLVWIICEYISDKEGEVYFNSGNWVTSIHHAQTFLEEWKASYQLSLLHTNGVYKKRVKVTIEEA